MEVMVSKTLIDIDDDLLAQSQEILETKTKKEPHGPWRDRP
jgi:Arc/MetJ family transcription regulator